MGEAKKILIVDDEPNVRVLLNRRLVAHRYEVIEAADGEEGLELARTQKPDLILLDVMMPRMDGLQTYRVLSEDPETANIPIIFLTVLAGKTSLTRKGLELMASAKYGKEFHLKEGCRILGKPYEAEVLVSEIRKLLGEGGSDQA